MSQQSYNKYLIENGLYSNLNEVNFIGEGCYGEAYQVSDEVILKITSDIHEAQNAINLIGKIFKNTVRVFDVQYNSEEKKFLILQEKLNTEIEDINIGLLYFQADFSVEDSDDEDYLNGFFNENKDNESINLESYLLHKEKIIKFIKDIENHFDELTYSNILSNDVHEGNIGKNKMGDYVVFDVSFNNSVINKENEDDISELITQIKINNEKYLKEILRGLGENCIESLFSSYNLVNYTLKNDQNNIEVYKSPLVLLSLDEENIYSPKILNINKRNDFFIVETEGVDYSIDSYVKQIILNLQDNKDPDILKNDNKYGNYYQKIIDVINSFNSEDENKLEYMQFANSAYDKYETLYILFNSSFGINNDGDIRIKNIIIDDYLDYNNTFYLDENINEIYEKYKNNNQINHIKNKIVTV